MNKISKLTDSDIDYLIKLKTIDNLPLKEIRNITGIGIKGLSKILNTAGLDLKQKTYFSDNTLEEIYSAYDSGIGVGGIAAFLNLSCSENPIRRVLKKKYGNLRNRSEQQFARMAKASPEEIAYLTKNAHKATRGKKIPIKAKIKRAKTMEGSCNKGSKWEPMIFKSVSQFFPNAIPNKAIDIYNLDIGIGDTIAVEVFGGGWSVSDKKRLNHYINRTKQLGKVGIHTIFIIAEKHVWSGNTSELIKTINLARRLPPGASQYWVIWGNRQGSSGLCVNINHSAFIRPFINIKDRRTGKYISIPN